MSDEMACKELVEVITTYLEGTISDEDRRRFEVHLLECPGCRTYLAQMQETVHALGELKVPASSVDRQQLLDLFRDWRQRR